MAGGVRNTKDRDALALEVRAGKPGVGRTSRDAAGSSSTNSSRVKVGRSSVENGLQSLCSETEAEIRLLLLWLSEEAQQTAREAAREQKPGNTSSQGAHPIPPRRGPGNSTQTELFEYQHGRPLPQKAG